MEMRSGYLSSATAAGALLRHLTARGVVGKLGYVIIMIASMNFL